MRTKTPVAVLFLVLAAFVGTGCETVNTTVIDARTGRPLARTRVVESNGTVRYTDSTGSVERTPGTVARVSRAGYRSVTTGY